MHIEDLNVGEYIAPLDGYAYFVDKRGSVQKSFLLRIIALDLPFAMVRSGSKRGLCDLRNGPWKRLSLETMAAGGFRVADIPDTPQLNVE